MVIFSTIYRIPYSKQNFAMVNRSWPAAAAGEADSVSSVSASVCHIAGPNSVNLGQFLLVYGNKDPCNSKINFLLIAELEMLFTYYQKMDFLDFSLLISLLI